MLQQAKLRAHHPTLHKPATAANRTLRKPPLIAYDFRTLEKMFFLIFLILTYLLTYLNNNIIIEKTRRTLETVAILLDYVTRDPPRKIFSMQLVVRVVRVVRQQFSGNALILFSNPVRQVYIAKLPFFAGR